MFNRGKLFCFELKLIGLKILSDLYGLKVDIREGGCNLMFYYVLFE